MPPGEQWEDYRTYAAIEAGSIPIVVRNSTYKGCHDPSVHLLETVPSILHVESWEELPGLLKQQMDNRNALIKAQRRLLEWLAAEKRRVAGGLYGAVRRMRGYGTPWRPKTTCDHQPLDSYEVAAQHEWLAKYWRMPQPRKDTNWNATAIWAYFGGSCVGSEYGWCEEQDRPNGTALNRIIDENETLWMQIDAAAGEKMEVEYRGSFGRPFHADLPKYQNLSKDYGFCEAGHEDWVERCLTAGCGLRLVYSYTCRGEHAPKPEQRPMW